MKTTIALNTTSGKAPIANGELYFETTGEGEPIIFFHAGFSDRRDWKYQVKDFSKRFQTIVYDQRGCGNSSPITTAFSPADDLIALMNHLKITKAIFIGHSIGGTIALDFTLQYPERVSALVLMSSSINGYSWPTEYLEWIMAIWNTPQPEEMTKQALSPSFYDVAMSNPAIKSEIEIITRESFQKILTWKTFDIRNVQWAFSDHVPKLKELKLPTFVVYGNKDSQDIKKIVQIFKKNIVNLKVVEMQNVDHLLNFEKPNELNSLILNFLSIQN